MAESYSDIMVGSKELPLGDLLIFSLWLTPTIPKMSGQFHSPLGFGKCHNPNGDDKMKKGRRERKRERGDGREPYAIFSRLSI